MKYNKKRNTAFLYEILIHEATKAVVAGDKEYRNKIIDLLKGTFSLKTSLGKALRIYKSVLESKVSSAEVGYRLLMRAEQFFARLNQSEIFQEQSALIETINSLDKNIFSNFIPNYKFYASLHQLFADQRKTDLGRAMLLETVVVESMVSIDSVMMESMDKLVYRTYIKKFNKKYNNALNETQRLALGHYIASYSDNGLALLAFVNETIDEFRSVITTSHSSPEINNDEDMKKKTYRVLEVLDSFSEEQLTSEMFEDFLKISSLVEELKKDASTA